MESGHDGDQVTIRGPRGELRVSSTDEAAWKRVMLIEGECGLDSRLAVADSRELQVAFGKIRAGMGDFPGRLLTLDPHRMPSTSKR